LLRGREMTRWATTRHSMASVCAISTQEFSD
jgi:hypothetical protein